MLSTFALTADNPYFPTWTLLSIRFVFAWGTPRWRIVTVAKLLVINRVFLVPVFWFRPECRTFRPIMLGSWKRGFLIQGHGCSGVTYFILILFYGFLYLLFRSLSTLLLRSSNTGSQLVMNSVLRTQRADRLYDLLTKRVSEQVHAQLLFPHSDKKQTNNH